MQSHACSGRWLAHTDIAASPSYIHWRRLTIEAGQNAFEKVELELCFVVRGGAKAERHVALSDKHIDSADRDKRLMVSSAIPTRLHFHVPNHPRMAFRIGIDARGPSCRSQG